MRFEEPNVASTDEAAHVVLVGECPQPNLLDDLCQRLRQHVAVKSLPRIDSEEVNRVLAAIESYQHWAREEFHAAHDHFRLLGEDNFRRYLPVKQLRIRIHPQDTSFDVLARAAAALTAGCRTTVSSPLGLTGPAAQTVELLDELTDAWGAAIEFVEEDDAELGRAIVTRQTDRVRYGAPERVSREIRVAAADALQYIADVSPRAHGRVELLWYFQEQCLSAVYHRYGNFGLRVNESRDEPG
jgi:RHH-type proline utilization regulon transcriptional repressor/proline dehydrogenase/delta 1-pyrroline-5-carboxylate dehydrogenase